MSTSIVGKVPAMEALAIISLHGLPNTYCLGMNLPTLPCYVCTVAVVFACSLPTCACQFLDDILSTSFFCSSVFNVLSH